MPSGHLKCPYRQWAQLPKHWIKKDSAVSSSQVAFRVHPLKDTNPSSASSWT